MKSKHAMKTLLAALFAGVTLASAPSVRAQTAPQTEVTMGSVAMDIPV